MATKTDEKKVKDPHPLLQQGTPPVDIEADHILKFTIFRLGGGGHPVHVETIDTPLQFTDPESIHRLVGGGTYCVKAGANPHTTGKHPNQYLGSTNFSWDGPPLVKPFAQTQAPQAPQAPAASIVEQASTQLPTIVSALGTVATTVLGFLTEARAARAAEDQRRREYDDNRRREEQAERDRRDAKERAEAEERRIEREREAEERRAEREQRENERRERERADAEARLAQQRDETHIRQERETWLMRAMLDRKDPNDALVQTLLGRALERPPPPPSASEEASKIIDAAAKLKDISSGESSKDTMEMIVGLANSPLVQTPAIQQALGRLLSIAGLHDKPGVPQAPPEPIMVPESAVVVSQIPEQVPPPPEPPPAPVDGVSVGGPVTFN